MVEFIFDTSKTIEENAQYYFEKSKTAKRKVEGAREALKRTEAKIKKLTKE